MNNAYESIYRCLECGSTIPASKTLTAAHPFKPNTTIEGCPDCREPVNMQLLCDNAGCAELATCGWPSAIGYRWTCATHYDYRNYTEYEKGLDTLTKPS